MNHIKKKTSYIEHVYLNSTVSKTFRVNHFYFSDTPFLNKSNQPTISQIQPTNNSTHLN